jgi:UPF0755 protein
MKRLLAILVVLGLLGFGTSRAIDWWNYNVNTPVSSSDKPVTFHIDLGETPSQIGTDLYDAKLIRSTIAFDVYTRMTNAGPKFQAGSFELRQNMPMTQIVSVLQHGQADEKAITFIEGYPLWRQAKIVDDKKFGSPPITGADYLQAAKNPALAATYDFLPKQSSNAEFPYEGYLFPDTYRINPATGAAGLVKAQLDQFNAVFSADWRAQIAQPTAGRPAEDIRSIVILASMVDREANQPNDRGNVCSVYYNRLKIGMELGVDATLLYALRRLSPEPTYAELQLNSPYNTRAGHQKGLPPSAIGNPGKLALAACINPPKTDFLFYFTDRQRVTHFETNERDFEADKQKYGVLGN